jgi:hypothetical protein
MARTIGCASRYSASARASLAPACAIEDRAGRRPLDYDPPDLDDRRHRTASEVCLDLRATMLETDIGRSRLEAIEGSELERMSDEELGSIESPSSLAFNPLRSCGSSRPTSGMVRSSR